MEREETYTVGEAARVLGVGQHRVRQMLREGALEGFRDESVDRWFAYQRSVHALKEERGARQQTRSPPERSGAPVSASVPLEIVRDLERELGRLEGRLELTEVAESTLREQLQRERERADRAEAALEAERTKGFWARLLGR